MHAHACIHAHTHAYTHAFAHTHVHMHMHTHTQGVDKHVFNSGEYGIYMELYFHLIHARTCLHKCTLHMHTHMHLHTHTYICTCTHTHRVWINMFLTVENMESTWSCSFHLNTCTHNACIHAHLHMHLHTHTYTCTCTHTHTGCG